MSIHPLLALSGEKKEAEENLINLGLLNHKSLALNFESNDFILALRPFSDSSKYKPKAKSAYEKSTF